MHESNSVLRHAFMACCELGEPVAIQGLGAWAASAFGPLRTLLSGDKADQPASDMFPGESVHRMVHVLEEDAFWVLL